MIPYRYPAAATATTHNISGVDSSSHASAQCHSFDENTTYGPSALISSGMPSGQSMICQAPFLLVSSGQAPQAPSISGRTDDGL